MRIKLDENLPEQLMHELAERGHDVDNIRVECLVGENDPGVWAAAQAESRFFVTQDLDFSDLRQFAPGSHHGLLLVRLGSPGRQALVSRITQVFDTADDVESWKGCFIVLTERKLRIQRSDET